MESRAGITFEDLIYQLALVDAKLQDQTRLDREAILTECKEVLELIARARRKKDALVGF